MTDSDHKARELLTLPQALHVIRYMPPRTRQFARSLYEYLAQSRGYLEPMRKRKLGALYVALHIPVASQIELKNLPEHPENIQSLSPDIPEKLSMTQRLKSLLG